MRLMRRDLFHYENAACPACQALRLHTFAELCEHHPHGSGTEPAEPNNQAAAPAEERKDVNEWRDQNSTTSN
jgi:hypothetical protein